MGLWPRKTIDEGNQKLEVFWVCDSDQYYFNH